MQLNYGQQPALTKGMIATGEDRSIDSYVNELLAQITTVTFAGVTDDAGDYGFTVTGPDGETVTVTHTAGGSEASAAIATAVAAAAADDEDLANIAVVTNPSIGFVALTFIHPGRVYVVESFFEAGTGAVSDTQDAGGSNIGLGVAVQDGSADGLCLVVDSGTVDADLLGITCRSVDGMVNDMDGGETAFKPGRTVSVMRKGPVVVQVEDAVTKEGAVYVRIDNGTALAPIGGFRSDDDGGDAIAMTGAKFGSSTTGRGLAIVRLNRA